MLKRSSHNPTIQRRDYQPPNFEVLEVEIGFDLGLETTTVATRLHLKRRSSGALHLDGTALKLLFVALDGKRLAARNYRLHDDGLDIEALPEQCVLDIAVEISPQANTTLSGLYVSAGNLFTQCEAEGFRRISYFPDRPDVMTRYTVMLRGDKKLFPVLLCNGNQVDSGDLGDGRHFAKWHDPHPKPCYLFALVAGRLASRERVIKLANGLPARLQIYVEKKDLGDVEHAMDSLFHAVRWDEHRFGLELDLERFMIVAVDDFNLGAMENKGLNIFNTKYVLANPDTSTDLDMMRIESIVGHEYFHNWTGNRVTCRDWFQLTLKEGLTVFRDQEFSADRAAGFMAEPMSASEQAAARAVHRIEAVRGLRSAQFPEDAGPMAHPIRPESYQEINNFYSMTVYEKGSEVVRMLQTLMGREVFRDGITEYFSRYDGQAVTCDDFIDAMEAAYAKASPKGSLKQFRRWYSQAGTPRLKVRAQFDEKARTYTLEVVQHTPRVGIEKLADVAKPPLHIPLRIGLLNSNGDELPLKLAGSHPSLVDGTSLVLSLTESKHEFVFQEIDAPPVPSLLRDFSAPVIVDYDYRDDELALLAAKDSDPFNRWEALQRLAVRVISARVQQRSDKTVEQHLVDSFAATLNDRRLDAMLRALALTLPGEYVIGEELPVYDPQAVHQARCDTTRMIGAKLLARWREVFETHSSKASYVYSAKPAADRALAASALGYIAAADRNLADELAWRMFSAADNMTDRFNALQTMVFYGLPHAQAALDRFYARHRKSSSAIDKWLSVQTTTSGGGLNVLTRVRELLGHPAFSYRNPNKVRSLLGSFFNQNPSAFHQAPVYAFWAEQVAAVDRINPSIAGRLARAMDRWRRLPESLQGAASKALETLQKSPGLSRDVSEIVEKALRV
jgi:aminopeptidase N